MTTYFNEKGYNPRVAVPEAPQFLDKWAEMGIKTRENHKFETIIYGRHPREVLDLFKIEKPKGLLIFIHGGYFRALSKDLFSWIAPSFNKAGYDVALINYPLCPEVKISDIEASCNRACLLLLKRYEGLDCVISGHSAGGFLTAAMVQALPTRFKGAMSISGIFDLFPVLETTVNEDLRMTEKEAIAWSIEDTALPIIYAVGGIETPEFLHQSRKMGKYLPIMGKNHFDVVDELEDENSELFKALIALF